MVGATCGGFTPTGSLGALAARTDRLPIQRPAHWGGLRAPRMYGTVDDALYIEYAGEQEPIAAAAADRQPHTIAVPPACRPNGPSTN